ncbi:PTS lactose/cellobiose transporter subunit IIA [Fusobacterium sp. FSA-380-WT-2B]|jgi:PTS system cellobiose-specific IIA component|uniref:PTS lactose/cellobiose transporter subunit IIA n=1 Tax=Fusobacterium sp. FSA-380-WT-2B TaxID=2605786 RepID=UPI0012B42D2A|nr:PTS lactose/cellobiose transporter subunit IIA [Fusobacterium sp. FSA-380-WT-2B]MDD7262993.1 PTS lactose/cellobiose transporter subunit IIA [Fusobacterium mortiferum]MDY5981681.1 PTS lactose/cellobiose transporter subunit IIA [Fusobacterium mortiferum]MSS61236.1 PTS lactose/cellobiose transporter subunit IIA [Fusobacterium sp. FSA-380-WT-2B]
MEQNNMDLETIAMTLVGNAGEGRSLAFEALNEAKKGNFEKAEQLLKESQKRTLAAHEIQTQLICNEADGNKTEMNLLMVHAQDHLMTSMLARELITELIEIYKNK